MPLKIVIMFWALTLFLFYLDPLGIYGSAPNQFLLLLFMSTNILILLLINRMSFSVFPPILSQKAQALKYFKWAFITSLILLPFNVYIYTGSSLTDFKTLLTDPAQAYARMHVSISADRSERMGFLLIKLALSWLTVSLVPLAILLQKNRLIKGRTLIAVFGVFFVLSVFRGTDKELGDIVVFMIAAMFIPVISLEAKKYNKTNNNSGLFSRRNFFLAIGFAIFSYIFTFRKSERLARVVVHCFQNTDVCVQYPPVSEHPFQYLFMMLYRYATHGYYGLSTSFNATLNLCPFIGDSRVLQYISGVFGISCENKVTDQLTELGWTSVGAWSTGFTQLANNFGHIGVYLYITFFAISLKVFYNTYCKQGCYLCGVMYILNFFILFYMPANLQLQQVGEQYFGYLILNFIILFATYFKQVQKS